MTSFLDRLFQLKQHGTSVSREVVAGLTTFAAMAYILAVNPSILSVSGMNLGAIITATALSSAVMTAWMGALTNYPLAMAPGMGINAFFAFTICKMEGLGWAQALGLVFYNGVFFLLLTLTGVRQKIVEAIPLELKVAISGGIGLFIAFIGLQSGGIISTHPETLVTLGSFHQIVPWLVLGGIVLGATLIARGWNGALIFTILVLTGIGFFIADSQGHALVHAPQKWVAMPASLEPTFMKLDFLYPWQHPRQALPLIFALLFIDLFDNLGTLIGVSKRAGLLDAQGNLPKIGKALAADAGAAMFGACLGTSTVTTYIESAAGVEQGGRTGLTSWVVGICFLASLVFYPLIEIIPAYATAPVLVIVGVLMMQGIRELEWNDFAKATAALVTVMLMPLTFSISEGIAIGYVIYVALMIGTGRARALPILSYVLAVLFCLHLWTR